MRDSIRRELNLDDQFGAIKMTRQVDKSVFLILEGEKDEKFFKPRCAKETLFVVAHNKDGVLELIQRLNKDSKITGYLGIVDKDYWGIVGGAVAFENLIIPQDHNDMENMLFTVNNVEKIVIENAIAGKYEQLGFDLRERVFAEAYKIALIRLYNENVYNLFNSFTEARSSQLALGEIDVAEYINPRNMTLDEDRLVKDLVHRNPNPLLSIDSVTGRIEIMKARYTDVVSLCNGHDIVIILSVAFKEILANYVNIFGGRVESWLRMAFDSGEFIKTDLYQKIKEWETKNRKIVLREIPL